MSPINWHERLQRWPIGVVGEFLGTRSLADPQARAARRWLRKLLKTDAEILAILTLLVDKDIIRAEDYEKAIQTASHTICQELEREFPGIVAREDGVSITAAAIPTIKDWP